MKALRMVMCMAGALLLAAGANAQRIRVTDGSLDVLKNEKEISLEFTYNNMKVGKFDKEADYVSSRVKDLNKKEAGKGDTWAKAWVDDRKERFEPKFEELFTQVTDMKIANKSKYILIFNTSFTEPGFNVGVMRKNAYISGEFTLVESADRNKVVAKGTLEKAPGRTFWDNDFDTGVRISEAYEMAGKALARYIR
ncbi:hypothetical protein [Chitinophaga deserti]|uniref:hypothetical protein n=1 Tax=Chitinophaga deserti TaxID=2164099 RepID=UPI001E3186E2|nr:hypothetical protein [Chitinophaga deserti]